MSNITVEKPTNVFDVLAGSIKLLPLTPENTESLKLLGKYMDLLTASQHVGKDLIIKKYGLVGRMAENIPVHLFDNEALNEIFKTAVTDGSTILINAHFFRKCVEKERESIKNKKGSKALEVPPVIIHEILHCIFEHTKRNIVNSPVMVDENGNSISAYVLAMEYSVNAMVRGVLKDFSYELGPFFEGFAVGAKKEDYDRFFGKSEYEIMMEILKDIKKNNPNSGKNGKPSRKGQGQGQGQNQGQGQGQVQGQGQGQVQGGGQGGGQGQGQVRGPHDSIVDPTEIRDELEKAGLGHIADAMRLPRTKEEEEKYKREALDRVINETARQAVDDEKYDSQRACSKALTSQVSERIKSVGQPSLSWGEEWIKSLIEEIQMMVSSVGHLNPIPDMQEDWNAVQDDSMFMESVGLKSGSDILFTNPHINFNPDTMSMVIVDTSGSVSSAMLSRFLTEIKGFAEECDQYNHPVYVMSADTVLRGDMDPVDPYDLDSYTFLGRGGTEIYGCLRDAYKLAKEDGKRLVNILYLTDGEDACNFDVHDTCPGVRVAFVLPPEGNPGFRVKNATTIQIDPKVTQEVEAPEVSGSLTM